MSTKKLTNLRIFLIVQSLRCYINQLNRFEEARKRYMVLIKVGELFL